ncbi:MAG: ribosome biogenesis GTPase YlqF [Erysipelotrichaceae bacterium]|nr:ribosome biogenesis GTPase YlqF [Erysipelotrichaceae bacterium]
MKDDIYIQWYPGHMTKAKREMQEKLKMVDMVIELRDARVPNASKNPMLEEIIQQKPRLIILSKKDKANAFMTTRWIEKLRNAHTRVLAINILQDSFHTQVIEESQELMKEKIAKMIRRGIRPRAIRAMVVGIPNVGKSTFINRIARKKVAQTGDRPGVTRSLQWVKVNQALELLDTPGVLWPKFEDPQVGVLLAVTGAIRDEVLPLEEISVWAMRYLISKYPQQICDRYHIEVEDDPYEMFKKIAEKRCFFLENQKLDHKRAMETFLRELRDDKLGSITWEELCEDSECA